MGKVLADAEDNFGFLEEADPAGTEDYVLEYAQAADDAGTGIFAYFPDADHFESNRLWYATFGLSRGQGLQTWLGNFAPDDAEGLRSAARKALAEGGAFAFEARSSGSPPRIHAIAGRKYGGSGSSPARLVGSVRDVTVERSALEDARAASRAKGDFLSMMSHELRTPLNAIVGLAHLLGDAVSLEDTKETAGKIARAARLLVGIVSDTLDMAQIDSGKLKLENRPFSPAAIVEEAKTLVEEAAAAKGLAVETKIGRGVPALCSGDSVRVTQVVLNLASNAIKFTERGAVAIEATAEEIPGGHFLLRYEVRDTGIGFDEATATKLFAPFVQADSSIRRRFGGSGLGLAISRKIALAMRGSLEARSDPGVGSVFTFAFPAAVQDLPPEEPGEEYSIGRRDEDGKKGLPVLVVEDDRLNRSILTRILAKKGYAAMEAATGEEGVSLFMASAFLCVLMDVQMPGMDGMEAARRMKALPRGKATPIVALTGNATAEAKAEARKAGMEAFLTKPIDPERLFSLLADFRADEARTALDQGFGGR